MKRHEIADQLKRIADEVKNDDPLVTTILIAVAGGLKAGDVMVDSLSQLLVAWAQTTCVPYCLWKVAQQQANDN